MKLRYNPQRSPLNNQESWLLALGAPLAAYSENFQDSISTGLGKGLIEATLGAQWGITDRPSFEQTTEQLVEEGHRTKYENIYQACIRYNKVLESSLPGFLQSFQYFMPWIIVKAAKAANTQAVADFTGESNAAIYAKIQASNDWLDELPDEFGVQPESLKSLVGWDATRLVNLCRWSHDLGIISVSEFVPLASRLNAKVKQAYKTWAEVAAAYYAGGLIWKYDEERDAELLGAGKALLTDPKSPFKQAPF
jgi:hypothetical protein